MGKRKKSVCYWPRVNVISMWICLHKSSLNVYFLGLQFTARVKMTEDEVILHFFQFNGNIMMLLYVILYLLLYYPPLFPMYVCVKQ